MGMLVKYALIPIGLAVASGLVLSIATKFDSVQKISLAIAILALTVFGVHTWYPKQKTSGPEGAKPAASSPTSPQWAPASSTVTGNAETSGDHSPAVTGNGNTFNYYQTTKRSKQSDGEKP